MLFHRNGRLTPARLPVRCRMEVMRALILLVALVGCGHERTEFRFPPEIAGSWKLAGPPVESLEQAWPDARTHGLEGLSVANYEGDGAPHVLAHRMSSSANAFESIQRFRPEGGTVAFQYGIFFIVVRSPALGQSALNRFAAELKQGISK
jgi:hypothetical protein